MHVAHTRSEVSSWSASCKKQGLNLGFVPTMGALHNGHLALVSRAKKENDRVAVSIFVNPIQFNNPEDLKKYPRILDQDLAQLRTVLGKDDLVFAPDEQEMYPEKVSKKFDFGALENVMEGAFRPGHFNGVGVVVDLLFSMVHPDASYFGEKDFQQLAVIRKLVEMEKHPTRIIGCQTVREEDGLAMSSRNLRLTPEHRKMAARIFSLLSAAKARVSSGELLSEIALNIENELNALPGFKTEYVAFADEKNLQPVTNATKAPFRCFIAVHAGQVRLIDNLSMY